MEVFNGSIQSAARQKRLLRVSAFRAWQLKEEHSDEYGRKCWILFGKWCWAYKVCPCSYCNDERWRTYWWQDWDRDECFRDWKGL